MFKNKVMTRVLFPLVIVTVLMLLMDLYAFQAVSSAFKSNSTLISGIFWSLSFFSIVSVLSIIFIPIPNWPHTLRTYLFSFIILLVLAKLFIVFFLLFEDFGRFIRWTFYKISNPDSASRSIDRSDFFAKFAVLVGAIPLVSGIYGMAKNAYDYQIHRVKVKLPQLPKSFEGMKIVQISDVHSGSFTAKTPIKRAIDMINKENPDLVFFTGDLVNSRADEFIPYQSIFGEIKAKEGVFSSLGNHDYGDYYRWRDQQEKDENMLLLHRLQAEMGWKLLMNENQIIERNGEQIAIIGIENWSAKRFGKRGKLAHAKQGAENVPVKLLLSHDPSHWDAQIRPEFDDIDITFSGHTHGAQFGIEIGSFKWSPSQYMYKQWAGLYQKGKQYLYVNRGFGFLGFPGRIGILPEITVMELHKA